MDIDEVNEAVECKNEAEVPEPIDEAERARRAYWHEHKTLKTRQTNAAIVRLDLLAAYKLIANVKLVEGLSDTMVRDCLNEAKEQLAAVTGDFLFRDSYWVDRIEKHKKESGY